MSISILVETYGVLSTIAVALLALTVYNTQRRGTKKGNKKSSRTGKTNLEFVYVPRETKRDL